ncbi:MAG: hypothetical protein HYZ34_05485 [Ignavibacteriae bacterium]|nr:hypothetical protein [Ignavibacteriota bacterium]
MKRLINIFTHGRRTGFLALSLLLSWSLINLACEDDTTEEKVNEIVFPETNVSYGKHVQPLFDRACAFGGCHGPDTFLDRRGFSLDSYQNMMNRIDIVTPGDPDNSILIWSVEGINGYDGPRRMPWNRSPLNENQIRGLRRWVAEGAHNN